MLVTRESVLFMKSIDSTDHMAEGGKKNAAYLADQINSVIKEVGGEHIVQVIMDGANRACWPIINSAFPHIVCAWCTAHVMDLLLEDIGKMDFFTKIWEQGKAIVLWIRQHQSFAAKFGTAFIMLSREIELQDEIVQLVHDKDLKATVTSMKPDAKARFSEVLDIVQNKEFWRKGTALVELCGPIMNLLRMADSDIPGTGKVYHENFKLGKILQSMTDSPEFEFIPVVLALILNRNGSLNGQILTISYMVLDTA